MGKVTLHPAARSDLFIKEYLVDLNATQAAIRAGYSPKTARQQGARLLSNVDIQAALQIALAARSERIEITADAVVAELAKLGFANMLDFMQAGSDGDPYVNFSKLTRDQAAALAEVTVDDFVDGRGEDARQVRRIRFKLADKRAALVDLGRHLGIFKPERLELTGKDGGPVEVSDARQRNLDLIEAVARRKAGEAEPAGTPRGDGEPQ
jgi:phage terminase small subunit